MEQLLIYSQTSVGLVAATSDSTVRNSATLRIASDHENVLNLDATRNEQGLDFRLGYAKR